MISGPLLVSALRPDQIQSKPFLPKGATRVEKGIGEANMNFRGKKYSGLGMCLSC